MKLRSTLGALLAAASIAAGCGNDASTALPASAEPEEEGAPPADPTCSAIERFAEVVTDVSVTYDYSPTFSPADLAAEVDVVFGGTLTGLAGLHSEVAPNQFDAQKWVGYEIRVDRMIKGEELLEPDGLAPVFVYNGSHVKDVEYYADAAEAALGAPVAIFAYDHEPIGELTTAIEGFVLSCEDGPLLGWSGGLGDWEAAETVSDVLDAVDRDSAMDPGQPVSVALWHCGVEPVTLEGQVWEVPDAETVDGHSDLPLDSTNTPGDWVGRGTAVIAADEMIYTDEGGEVIRFVPDDGRPPGPCA